MGITFIVPVLNGESFIAKCIDSILSEADLSDELVIVDNGSSDNTVKIVTQYERTRLVVYPCLTVSALRNRGAGSAKNDLLAFIDADCILCDGWREHVIEAFSDASVHAAGSLYDIPDDAHWIETAWFSQKFSSKGPVKYINSGNFVVRKDVFIDVGGFDESMVSDEDCELGQRMNNSGYQLLEDPAIRVVHLGNAKSLREFFAKEDWHATSAIASLSFNTQNLPAVMSVGFAITVMVALICIVAALLLDSRMLWGVLLVLLVPLSTAVYRAIQFNAYNHIPALALLWSLSYTARIKNMIFRTAG